MLRVGSSERTLIQFDLNGRQISGYAEPQMLLSDFLRNVAGATGTHVGCEHGVCGCYTVLLDGAASRSCLTLAVQAHGRAVATVESLAPADAAQFYPDGIHCELSISVGATTFSNKTSFSELYKLADRRLYDAKRNGRDRVELAGIAAVHLLSATH